MNNVSELFYDFEFGLVLCFLLVKRRIKFIGDNFCKKVGYRLSGKFYFMVR